LFIQRIERAIQVTIVQVNAKTLESYQLLVDF